MASPTLRLALSLAFLAAVASLGLLVRTSTAENVLFSPNKLNTDERLVWDKYTFVMQGDCNAVLYGGGWQSNTAKNGIGCYLTVGTNGILRIRDKDGRQVWANSNSVWPTGEYVALIHPEGKLKVYGPVVWSTRKTLNADLKLEKNTSPAPSLQNIPQVSNLMFSGQVLYGDGKLVRDSYSFVMQGDCNLVLYGGGWQSNTHGNGKDCFLRLDHYGGLTILDDAYKTVWKTGVKQSYGEYVAAVTPTGEVKVYGPSIWSTVSDKLSSMDALPTDDIQMVVV